MLSSEKYTTSTFRNKKEQNIFYRNWKTETPPNAIMLIVHGFNSHSGYFHSFATQLNEINIEVYAIDLCGRGQSDGEGYYISSYQDVVSDIDQLLAIGRTANPIVPAFLYGHSAGGVFASVYAVQHQEKLRGLISASLALKLPAPGFALAAIKLLAYIIPHKRLVRLDNEDFSRDRSVVDTMNNDPLLVNEKQPGKTMQQLILAGQYLKRKMTGIKLSLLILHGLADKATKPDGSRYFIEHASSNDKQIKLYEGHYHDLLNDKYNGIVVRDIIRWLIERI